MHDGFAQMALWGQLSSQNEFLAQVKVQISLEIVLKLLPIGGCFKVIKKETFKSIYTHMHFTEFNDLT